MVKLTAESLSCVRGERRVFSGIAFAVDAGEGMLLTGPNGAGKTSLLRLIAGFLAPAAGRIELDGVHADLAIGQSCHYVGHLDGVKPAFTVGENLLFWAQFLGGGDIDRALSAFELERLRDLPAGFLSAGQKRRLALSRLALVSRPVWLLDEPSVSLDKRSLAKLVALIRQHLKADGLVLASSHMALGIKFDHNLELGATGARR